MNDRKPLYREKKLTLAETARRDELFRELGRAYYEGAYEDPLPQLLPLFDQLTELLKEPDSSNQCPVCGAELAPEAAFCEECGHRIGGEQPKPAQPEVRHCPNCGNVLSPEARFCGKCGTKID